MNTIKLLAAVCLAVCLFVACDKPVTGKDGTKYESYQQACRAQDYEAAYVFVDRVENKKGSDSEDFLKIRDYVVSSEILYLLSMSSEEASNRVLYLITEIKPAERLVAEGFVDLHIHWNSKNGSYPDKERIDAYRSRVETYNKQCGQILDLAIQNKNQKLAQSILKSFIPSVEVEVSVKEQTFGVDHECYNVSYSERAKESAQAKYDEAVASGAFNN